MPSAETTATHRPVRDADSLANSTSPGRRRRSRARLICLLTVVAVGGGEALAEVGQFEKKRMAQLAAVQANPASRLAPFETDGCSGGLSAGWRWLAEQFPSFRRLYGEQPPWESCCIAHDRVYWRGETEDGYTKRAQADEALRRCVVTTGERLRDALSERHGITPETVEKNFLRAADTMHNAVRAGGGPCTAFAWRWGYGWPACPTMTR